MDFSTGDVKRVVGVGSNNEWVVERTEDFTPYIEIVKRKREIAANGTTDSGVMAFNAYVLPNSLAELLISHGINAFNPSSAEFNFIHDWLKQNFPALMVYPNKNMKIAGAGKAVPTRDFAQGFK